MRTVDVKLPQASYRICIEHGVQSRGAGLRQLVRGSSALLVSDTTVAPLYAPPGSPLR